MFTLSFADTPLENLSFVAKFVREFQKIEMLDFGDQELAKEDAIQLSNSLQFNTSLQHINLNKKSGEEKLKKYFQIELEKNKKIQELGEVIKDGTLHLQDKDIQDFSILPKIVQDFSQLKILDLSNNNLRSADQCDQVFQMLDDNHTIEKLVISNCKINNKGLNAICNHLASTQHKTLLELDIRDNPIPDPQFKMLFSLLQNNDYLVEIKYTLNDEDNIKKLETFKHHVEE